MTSRERPALRGISTITVKKPKRLAGPASGISQVVVGFGAILAAGTFLLWLPFANETDGSASFLEALFTATSAICVTGLIIVDTPTFWSPAGEVVILVLIQIGGLGYMLGTTVILWALGRRMGLRDQNMLRLYYGAPSMRETLGFAKSVAIFTFVFEAVGALILFAAFWLEGESLKDSAWWGVFHSVSAFNNAGFSITGAEMLPYTHNPVIMLTISLLIIAGGVGFIPFIAFRRRRSFRRLPLDSKLVFATTGMLLLVGTLFFTVVEWRNQETLGSLPPEDRVIVAFFHGTGARTAGFAGTDVGALHDESKLATVGLMFVGGAAGSTAGGLKVGAFALLFAVMLATLRGRTEVSFFRRQVPVAIVQQATTLALYYVGMVFGFSLALTFASDVEFLDVLFETVSALSTVGYSSAGTLSFGNDGHVVLIVAMLFGRFSPLLVVLYIAKPRKKPPFHHPMDSVRLG
ncbi:MAG: TrkH family potassium uptake protein [Dehalococcoidia bacterium]